MNINDAKYKDVDSVLLENEELRVNVVPGHGSKIASIVYKPQNRELLWQHKDSVFRRAGYGASYLDGEMSGFDEMFPTISRCFYESAPWEGIEMPDHGEVWAVPWDCAVRENHVELKRYGIRFPYLLAKEITLNGSVLVIKYRARNLSHHPFDFIWAAHPLFAASQGIEFIVPKGMDRIVNSVAGPVLGKYGKNHNFPSTKTETGNDLDLNKMPPQNTTGYQKYFFAGKVTEGWCMLFDHRNSLNIGLSYPVENVPYLGMWLNEGGMAGQYNIAPEPCTGGMDRVDFSKMWGMGSVLAPKEEREWYLNISVASGDKAAGVDQEGNFITGNTL